MHAFDMLEPDKEPGKTAVSRFLKQFDMHWSTTDEEHHRKHYQPSLLGLVFLMI